jgi:hypothetical protein
MLIMMVVSITTAPQPTPINRNSADAISEDDTKTRERHDWGMSRIDLIPSARRQDE